MSGLATLALAFIGTAAKLYSPSPREGTTQVLREGLQLLAPSACGPSGSMMISPSRANSIPMAGVQTQRRLSTVRHKVGSDFGSDDGWGI